MGRNAEARPRVAAGAAAEGAVPKQGLSRIEELKRTVVGDAAAAQKVAAGREGGSSSVAKSIVAGMAELEAGIEAGIGAAMSGAAAVLTAAAGGSAGGGSSGGWGAAAAEKSSSLTPEQAEKVKTMKLRLGLVVSPARRRER